MLVLDQKVTSQKPAQKSSFSTSESNAVENTFEPQNDQF